MLIWVFKTFVEFILVLDLTNLGIPISLSIAMMSFVGNEMGKANIRLAKIYITMGVSIFTITCLISSFLVWNL